MKFTMMLPIEGGAAEGPAVIALAQAAEAAGFDMLSYTDHPAPARKWLTTGGHPTFDPFAGLAFVAAVTQRIRLSTCLAVLPYRNPLPAHVITAADLAPYYALLDRANQ